MTGVLPYQAAAEEVDQTMMSCIRSNDLKGLETYLASHPNGVELLSSLDAQVG